MMTDENISAFLSLNEYGRTAITCKPLTYTAVYFDQYKQWVTDALEHEYDQLIEWNAIEEENASTMTWPSSRCIACGGHNNADWLGLDECWSCYEEHTD